MHKGGSRGKSENVSVSSLTLLEFSRDVVEGSGEMPVLAGERTFSTSKMQITLPRVSSPNVDSSNHSQNSRKNFTRKFIKSQCPPSDPSLTTLISLDTHSTHPPPFYPPSRVTVEVYDITTLPSSHGSLTSRTFSLTETSRPDDPTLPIRSKIEEGEGKRQ